MEGVPDLLGLTDPERLAALQRERLLDAPRTEGFDRLTRMAAELVGAPFALVTLIDADRQFFLSCVGTEAALGEARETPLSHSLCQYVVAGKAPLVVADARDVSWLRENGAVTDLGVVAYLGFPLVARDGRPIGSLCVLDDKPRVWTDHEQRLIRDFAALAQSELDLRAARDDARRTGALLARLSGLTDAVATAGDVDGLLGDIVAACARTFAADVATVELLDDQGRGRRRAVHGSAPAAVEVRSSLRVPLPVVGHVQGSVSVGARAAGAYRELDRELLAAAAERFAAAIARAEAQERDRHVARTLEAALQPDRLPELPDVRLVARYEPAERGLGGDWYDAFRLGDGGLGVAIGDVVGHGIEAAAEAVRLRNMLRGSVLGGCGPAESVAALNAYAADEPGAFASTLLYMELDAASRRLCWASAGHLPGIVAEGGRGEWLGMAGGPPLGVRRSEGWPAAERTLARGARVVVFTDGLVERRGEPLDAGIARVLEAAASAPDLERLADAALAQAPAPRFDDLALLALELD